MTGFDIKTLLQFQPPQYHCQRCLALFKKDTVPGKHWTEDKQRSKCPVCHVQYIEADYKRSQVDAYLRACGYEIKIPDVVPHTRQLARIASDMNDGVYTGEFLADPMGFQGYSAFEALLEAIRQAQVFIHITSVGISRLFLGAFLVAAQRVHVRGVILNIDEELQADIKQLNQEAPGMWIQSFGKDSTWRETPHQKLVVIDGLLAFKGSANLSDTAWRKIAKDREMVEAVTDIESVIDLHNRYFSPIWAKMRNQGDRIEMHDYPF